MPVESPEEALSDRIGLAEVMDKLGHQRTASSSACAFSLAAPKAKPPASSAPPKSKSPAASAASQKWMREQLLDAL